MGNGSIEWLKRVAVGTASMAAVAAFLGAACAEEKPAAAAEKKAEQKAGEAKPKAKAGAAKDKPAGAAKAAEEVKPAAEDPKKVEEEERARRIKAAEAFLKTPEVGEPYYQRPIAKMSAEIKVLNLELEQYTQVEDPKERRAAEQKARGVQGKIKRVRGAFNKELVKTYKPLKAQYDALKRNDKALQAKIEATSDEKQKGRMEGERAKAFGAMEGLERELGIMEFFIQDCEPPKADAAPADANPKP